MAVNGDQQKHPLSSTDERNSYRLGRNDDRIVIFG